MPRARAIVRGTRCSRLGALHQWRMRQGASSRPRVSAPCPGRRQAAQTKVAVRAGGDQGAQREDAVAATAGLLEQAFVHQSG
jgi:hypothetical protein